jgi:hypothetical protein
MYYKLLQKRPNGYYSYNVYGNRPTSLKYEIGKVTVPVIANSKLFVFDTLQNLYSFVDTQYMRHELSEFAVFSCKVTNPTVGEYIAPTDDLSIIEAWANNFIRHEGYKNAPIGTYYVDSVELVEKISWDSVKLHR